MSKTTKQSFEEAQNYIDSKKGKLTAYDFNKITIVIHDDGSSFQFHFSFMEEDNKFIYVFTEHNGYHFFYKEDLIFYTFIEER